MESWSEESVKTISSGIVVQISRENLILLLQQSELDDLMVPGYLVNQLQKKIPSITSNPVPKIDKISSNGNIHVENKFNLGSVGGFIKPSEQHSFGTPGGKDKRKIDETEGEKGQRIRTNQETNTNQITNLVRKCRIQVTQKTDCRQKPKPKGNKSIVENNYNDAAIDTENEASSSELIKDTVTNSLKPRTPIMEGKNKESSKETNNLNFHNFHPLKEYEMKSEKVNGKETDDKLVGGGSKEEGSNSTSIKEMKIETSPSSEYLAALKKKRKARTLKELEFHGIPGILSLCRKPEVFPSQMKLNTVQAQSIAHDLLHELQSKLPDYSEEVPLVPPPSFKQKSFSYLVDPERVEMGYFKSHLTPDFVESLGNSLPNWIRIKRNVRKKGIAFMSTKISSLCDTHYDQDTSFLLVLTGKKEIFYAPPCMIKRLRVDHPVLHHSSIFEEVNPFVTATGPLWQFITLTSGDGLLLPQGWLHSVKSTPGTTAVSFQVESSGTHANVPVCDQQLRRSRMKDVCHISTLPRSDRNKELKEKAEDDKPISEEISFSERIKEKRKNSSQLAAIEANVFLEKNAPISTIGKKKMVAALQAFRPKTSGQADMGLVSKKVTSTKISPFRSSIRDTRHPESHTNNQLLESSKSLQSTNDTIKSLKRKSPSSDLNESTISPSSSSHGVRRSKREKLSCGIEGCKNIFPVNGLTWVMMLSLDTKTPRTKSKLPFVPTYHPKHLICLNCKETKGDAFFEPVQILTDKDKNNINGWEQYMYYTASRADYEAKLRLND